tara:strand:+ start:944 stop:1057 length:114 start_codon:yes stop_codon:yes gene_type:complete
MIWKKFQKRKELPKKIKILMKKVKKIKEKARVYANNK